MASTRELALTGAWQAVAAAGDVHVSPSNSAVWAITSTPAAPAFDGGHVVYAGGAAMTLEGPERLWVKGTGALYVTAAAPL